MSILDLFSQLDFNSSQSPSATDSNKTVVQNDTTIRITELENRLNRLSMISMALWKILKKQTPDLTDAQLYELVKEIDLRDGKLDGQYIPEAKACPNCGKMMNPQYTQCLYCGAEDPEPNAFLGT
jgi:hypothetical protein